MPIKEYKHQPSIRQSFAERSQQELFRAFGIPTIEAINIPAFVVAESSVEQKAPASVRDKYAAIMQKLEGLFDDRLTKSKGVLGDIHPTMGAPCSATARALQGPNEGAFFRIKGRVQKEPVTWQQFSGQNSTQPLEAF